MCGGRLILTTDQIKTRFRRILGSLVWLTQTQHQVAFSITKFATDAPYSCSSVAEVKLMVVAANKILQPLKSHPLVIFYHPLFKGVPTNEELQSLKLMSFSDCGFASPRFDKSIESVFLILSCPLARDGEILLQGHLLEGSSRKIPMSARITIAGESIALANAVDSSLWIQSVLMELYLGIVPSSHLNSTDIVPINSPFGIYRPDKSSSSTDKTGSSSQNASCYLGSSLSFCDPGKSDGVGCARRGLSGSSISVLDSPGECHLVHLPHPPLGFSSDSDRGAPCSFHYRDSAGSTGQSCDRVQFLPRMPASSPSTDERGRQNTSFVVLVDREVVIQVCDECTQWSAISCQKLTQDFP